VSLQLDDLSRVRVLTRVNAPSTGTELYLRRLEPARVRQELAAMRKDGLDNLVLKSGQDTYVASSLAMDTGKFRRGQEVVVDQGGRGFRATVREVNDEVNSDGDVFRRSLPCAIPGAVLGAFVGGGAGVVVGAALGSAACMAPLTGQQLDNTLRK
jgi:hypothetical protein